MRIRIKLKYIRKNLSIIFLYKIMNFGTLFNKLDPDLRKIVRRIEMTRRKFIKRKCSKFYLNKYNDKNMQPKHLRNIHMYLYSYIRQYAVYK